jgi:hypothetical protein
MAASADDDHLDVGLHRMLDRCLVRPSEEQPDFGWLESDACGRFV